MQFITQHNSYMDLYSDSLQTDMYVAEVTMSCRHCHDISIAICYKPAAAIAVRSNQEMDNDQFTFAKIDNRMHKLFISNLCNVHKIRNQMERTE